MNKHMIARLIPMFLSLMLLTGCSQQRSLLQEQIAKAAASGKYALLYVVDSDDPESNKQKEAFIAAASDYSAYTSVVEANYGSDKESIDAYLNLQGSLELPAVVMIAPNGAKIETFQVPVQIEEIMNARVTAAESEVLLSLQNGRIAVLCVYAKELEEFKYIETKLTEGLLTVSDKAVIHYLNPALTDDRKYIEKLSLPLDQSMIYVMLPSGEVIERYPLNTINTTDLLDLILKHSLNNW